MRKASLERITKETQISLELNLDGNGNFAGKTGCGFLDHMLDLFTYHGGFDLKVNATGDTDVDYHHLVEDMGISLGNAFLKALGDLKGITRYGSFIIPMDETLLLTALDISGRNYLGFDVSFPTERVYDFDTELVEEFFLGFSRTLKMNLHFKLFSGKNTHHIIEAMFKAFGRALSIAVSIDEKRKDEIPSTKGIL